MIFQLSKFLLSAFQMILDFSFQLSALYGCFELVTLRASRSVLCPDVTPIFLTADRWLYFSFFILSLSVDNICQ
jgi:hypothetical protein